MPVLSAVSSSARQLYTLLRCISFAPRAHVQLSPDGIRFSVDDSNAMQGLAFLDKSLFTTYHDTPTTPEDTSPPFQISLIALLETLQILYTPESGTRSGFGNRDSAFPPDSHNPTSAFSNTTLGVSSICRITYPGPGSPLSITLEEGALRTVCNLVTYEPESPTDIPFSRTSLAFKIVLPAPLLHDAILELSSLTPSHLTLSASPTTPHFSLSATGSLGSASVDFSKDGKALETFQVPRRRSERYMFGHVGKCVRAMGGAVKVSVRGDGQGVLSLQFMVEVGEVGAGGGVTFVDFRFVPVLDEEDGEDDGERTGSGSDS